MTSTSVLFINSWLTQSWAASNFIEPNGCSVSSVDTASEMSESELPDLNASIGSHRPMSYSRPNVSGIWRVHVPSRGCNRLHVDFLVSISFETVIKNHWSLDNLDILGVFNWNFSKAWDSSADITQHLYIGIKVPSQCGSYYLSSVWQLTEARSGRILSDTPIFLWFISMAFSIMEVILAMGGRKCWLVLETNRTSMKYMYLLR
jgi:hypothetical protein